MFSFFTMSFSFCCVRGKEKNLTKRELNEGEGKCRMTNFSLWNISHIFAFHFSIGKEVIPSNLTYCNNLTFCSDYSYVVWLWSNLPTIYEPEEFETCSKLQNNLLFTINLSIKSFVSLLSLDEKKKPQINWTFYQI